MGVLVVALITLLMGVEGVAARSAGEPIRLAWTEGDVAGLSPIFGPDSSRQIGSIEYHQQRTGDVISTVRVARFTDGSSDEDSAEARVGEHLEAIRGRSIIRDARGEATVDITIDVAGDRLRATWGTGDDQKTMDERVELPPGTYWGPLIFILIKNFDTNADDGRVVFRTVAPTPRPYVFDMALDRQGNGVVERPGARLDTVRYDLTPTIHWTLDPLIRLVAPRATFWVLPGEPPALARFTGPRNYARQPIVIQ